MRDFSREELIRIRDRAKDLAAEEYINATWRRAYLTLADAADHLDTMWAKAECKQWTEED